MPGLFFFAFFKQTQWRHRRLFKEKLCFPLKCDIHTTHSTTDRWTPKWMPSNMKKKQREDGLSTKFPKKLKNERKKQKTEDVTQLRGQTFQQFPLFFSDQTASFNHASKMGEDHYWNNLVEEKPLNSEKNVETTDITDKAIYIRLKNEVNLMIPRHLYTKLINFKAMPNSMPFQELLQILHLIKEPIDLLQHKNILKILANIEVMYGNGDNQMRSVILLILKFLCDLALSIGKTTTGVDGPCMINEYLHHLTSCHVMHSEFVQFLQHEMINYFENSPPHVLFEPMYKRKTSKFIVTFQQLNLFIYSMVFFRISMNDFFDIVFDKLESYLAMGGTTFMNIYEHSPLRWTGFFWNVCISGDKVTMKRVESILIDIVKSKTDQFYKSANFVNELSEDNFRKGRRLQQQILHPKGRQNPVVITDSDLSQAIQIYSSLLLNNSNLHDMFTDDLKRSIYETAKVFQFSTTKSQSQKKICDLLRHHLKIPIREERFIVDFPQQIIDITIEPFDEKQKLEFLSHLFGPRPKTCLQELDQCIKELEVPFRNNRKHIALEVDGHFHFIDNLTFIPFQLNLSALSELKDSHKECVGEVTLPNEETAAASQSMVLGMFTDNLKGQQSDLGKSDLEFEVIDDDQIVCQPYSFEDLSKTKIRKYYKGSCAWKRRLYQQIGWYQIAVPLQYSKKAQIEKLQNIKSILPIDWNMWEQKIHQIEELYEKERES